MPEGAVIVDRRTKWGNWFVVQEIGTRYSERLADTLPDSKALVVVAFDKWGNRTGAQWGGFTNKAEATAFAVELHRRSLLATRVDVDGLVHHERYLGDLRGRDLACWCALDQPCHADVLLELANEEATP